MDIRFTSNVDEGLAETVRSVADADAVHGVALFVATQDDLPSTLDVALRELSVPAFGGLFPSVLHDGDAHEEGAVVAGLALEPDVSVVEDIDADDAPAAADLDPELVERDNRTAFVFVDAHADGIDAFVEALFDAYGVELNFLGGGAGILDAGSRPCVFTNDGVVSNAGVVAGVTGESTIGVNHGWQEIAGPFRVTAADGPMVEELDGRPAYDVYREAVEANADVDLDSASFFDVATSYPLGISRMDDERIVRDPFEMEDDAIRCFGAVAEHEHVHVLKGEVDALVDAAGVAYEDATAGVDGGTLVSFDCISRALYLDDHFERELDAVAPSDRPVLGALTIGEVANGGDGYLEYYNKTAVAAVVTGI
jgi:hypothetical protein